MNETEFWRARKKKLPIGHYCRIESPICPGYPDVDYCVNGEEGHLELKYRPVGPIRKTTAVFSRPHGLRVEQIAWIRERLKHGGRVFVFAGVGRTNFLIRLTPELVDTFNALPMPQLVALNELSHKTYEEALTS